MTLPIVVIGASSFIGTHLLTAIPTSKDFEVRALVRKRDLSSENHAGNVRFFSGDLLRPKTLKGFLEAECTVINLAYLREAGREVNLEALKNLADMCVETRIKRLVHCSTAMVHGDLRQDVIDESTPCAPTTVYETTKRDMECLLQAEYASQFEVAILRPTAVFGPNGKNLLKLADELSQGHRVTSYLKACLFHSRCMNLVCVGNVAAATWFLADPMRSLSETIYLISDDDQENNSYGYVRNYLMERLGIRPDTLPIVPVPTRMAQTVLRATGNVRTHPRQVYIGNNLAKEGFANPIVLEDALDEFVSWYRGAFPR